MKRLLIGIFAALALAAAYLVFFPMGQQADRTFDAKVASPAYVNQHPLVLFDAGHYNSHSLRGGYRAFGQLLRSDGYSVETIDETFTERALSRAAVLVIVNAAGGSNPKLFGINLVPLRKGRRDGPAFSPQEIAAIKRWVSGGGSLLLVADHHPYGSAAAELAAAFGVTMHCGLAEVPDQYAEGDPGNIKFSRDNGLLADSPITSGVQQVVSFTGQSLDAPNAIALLKLPPASVEYVPPPPQFHKVAAGAFQGAALTYGRGRVVVLGEAAMLTAQVDRGHKFGMNVAPGNRQFVLNVMHWLAGLY